MVKILITGGSGYIAKSLINCLIKYESTSITRQDFDLTDKEATDKWFDGKYFDVIIHTAIAGGSRLNHDDGNVFYQNLKMFYNLYYNKDHFNKFIQFGSGAEIGSPSDPYGLSKKIINELIQPIDNFFNLRIFGVFDENELDTRFIKSNIKRYINRQDLIIHQDKLMDFFYMEDLIILVNHYITAASPPKITEGSYPSKLHLSDIINFINTLGNHRSRVVFQKSGLGKSYIGSSSITLPFIGLLEGIKTVYEKLL